MTAVDLPRFSAADHWLVRCDSIRRVAHLVTHKRITEKDGHARVTRLTRNLEPEDRNDAWEQLLEAEKRIAYIRSGPAASDRDDRELAADWDAIDALKKLAGPRPGSQT